MLRVRSAFALVLAITFVQVAESEAQPQGKGGKRPAVVTTPTALAVLLLPGIDDPNVVAELKLMDEQVKKLVAGRQTVWDESYTIAPKDLATTAAARATATDALLKQTLTPTQYQRAVQLGAQNILAGRGEPAGTPRVTATTFKRYPELVTAYQLTEEQKKQLAAGTDRTTKSARITLTPAQSAAAKAYLGPVPAKPWVANTDPRLTNRPAQPADLSLLLAQDVQTATKLADEQVKALTEARAKWTKLAADRLTDLSPKDADTQAVALKAETEKLLAATLKPEQTVRLKQIAFQNQLRNRGIRGIRVEQLYKDATVVKELALTEQQVKALDSLWETYAKEATKVFEAGEPFAATEKRVKELAAARQAKAEAVVNAGQVAKLKTLVGETFVGSTQPGPFLQPDNPGYPSAVLTILRTATFGQYSAEFSQLAGNKSFQDELKMTAEQIKEAVQTRDELLTKFRLTFPNGDNAEFYTKTFAERSKAIETALGKVLNAEQAKRFREIMLQSRGRQQGVRSGLGSITTTIAYPGVAEAVKVTDEQKKKLLAGDALAEVLTADQNAAISRMLGEPFKGDFTIPRTNRSPVPAAPAVPARPAVTPTSATLRLFTARPGAPSVEEALKLTPEQTQKIAAAQAEYQTAVLAADRRALGAAAHTEATKAAVANFEKAVDGTLNADQKKRAAQLTVQSAAAANLVATLTAADMLKTLGLTTEQTAKLTALGEDAVKLQELRVSAQVSDPERKLALRLRDTADERMLAVLTDTQKAKWQELIGAPWAGLTKVIPTRGFVPRAPRSGRGGSGPSGFNP